MSIIRVVFFLVSALVIRAKSTYLLRDINKISGYWGRLSPYLDNPDNYFGVEYTGLPDGCQIESVQVLQRHAERQPDGGSYDGRNILRFIEKIKTISTSPDQHFTGPLNFLDSWNNILGTRGLLTNIGAVAEFKAGADFWNRYGRILYNASVTQLSYDPKFLNGTARPSVVLRTTDQSRMHNTQINWALGFFGPTIEEKPNPSLLNATQPYNVVIIPEETKEKWNNTLAPYITCPTMNKPPYLGSYGQDLYSKYVHNYLENTVQRLQNFAPVGMNLTTEDVYTMQLLCAYETALVGFSEFCSFFTENEWACFENAADIKFYNGFSYGNPGGRAQGIGYVQEMLARLNHTLIPSSNSAVNSTLDGNPSTFPTNQAFYADFTHDAVLISVLTALSIEYFHSHPSSTDFSPDPDRKFRISKITPFGSNLVTESIGCNSPNPKPRKYPRAQYSPGQYGYEASLAPHKFVRMRLNNAVIPLNTIRGGACGDSLTSRVDGMCPLESFFESQKYSTALANYEYVCYGNYTLDRADVDTDWDGTIFP